MSIDDRRLWSVSPSAITQYTSCARTWWYGYVKGVRGPTPPHMAKGTSIHAALEHYLKTGEVLISHKNRDSEETWQVMEFVQAAIPFLPKPINDPWWKNHQDGQGYDEQGNQILKPAGNCGLMLEQDGTIGTYEDGPSMVMYVDMIEAHDDWAMITDYKTLSDKKYAKSPAELAENVQLICNAKFLFSISDYKVITLRHLYLLTKGARPKAFESKVEVTREHVDAEFDKILVHVRAMCQWYKLNPETAEPLPPTISHCDAYGGCSFREKCFGTNELFTIKSRMTEGDKMSLLNRMVKKAGVVGTVAEVTEPAPVVASPAPKTGLLGRMKTVEPEVLTPETAQAAAVAAGYPVEAPKPYVGIVPPDAPVATSTPEEVAAEIGEDISKEEAAETAAVVTEPQTVDGVQRIKRKRRTKAEMEAERAAETLATPEVKAEELEVVTVDAPTDPAVVKLSEAETVDTLVKAENSQTLTLLPGTDLVTNVVEESEAQKIYKILTTPDPTFPCGVRVLFIDCLPGKGWTGPQPEELTSFLHAFNRLASDTAGVADYRLIRFESRGYLATAMKLYARGLPPAMYVDSRTPGADTFMETVLPYCQMVFRGTR